MTYKLSILIATCFSLVSTQPSFATEGCLNPAYKPYDGTDKLACWIKRDNSNSMDGVLLIPFDKTSWVAWIYQSVFYAEPIMMAVTYNDCHGLGLRGSIKNDTYSLSIEEIGAKLVGTIMRKESLKRINFVGECQILSEDQYTIMIQKRSN